MYRVGMSNTIKFKKTPVIKVIFAHLQMFASTCQEVEQLYNYKHQTASPRFNELRNAGIIRKTGEVRQGSDVYEVVPGATIEQFRKPVKKVPTFTAPKAKLEHLVRSGFLQSYSTSDKVEGDRLFIKFPDGTDLEFRP